MHWGYWDGWTPWHMGGWLMMLLFWIAVIAFAVWMVRGMSGARSREEPTALEILKQRYARGEIDKTEFEQKKKDLLD